MLSPHSIMTKKLLSVSLFCVAVSAAASAQTFEFSVLGGYPRISGRPLGSVSPEDQQDNDTKLKGKYSYGGVFTFNTRGYYGHEIGYLFNRAEMTSIVRSTPEGATEQQVVTRKKQIPVHMGFYNFLIYFMPNGERWRPYITGGLQLYQYGNPHFPDWEEGGSRNYGANWGGGLKLKLASHALMRFDVRDYIGGKPWKLSFVDPADEGGRIHQIEATVGFGITF